jgi:hypothetical protein
LVLFLVLDSGTLVIGCFAWVGLIAICKYFIIATYKCIAT